MAASGLAPYLLFGFPAAVHALRVLARAARVQNPVAGVLLADDKAATAQRLAQAGVAQLRTEICAADPGRLSAAAERIGYPVVVKRTHGAQGRWVRRAADPAALAAALAELAAEGPGALVVQPEVTESAGRSVRAVITGGRLLAVTERTAAAREWRSNIAGGAAQHRVELTGDERELVLSAARAVGLGHAGVDLLRTRHGPRVLEGLISSNRLLSGSQREQMDDNCLGWDCSIASQPGYRGKYGGCCGGTAGLQIFFGILAGTIPVVIATNSTGPPPLPAVVQTALHTATSPR